ncbi:MAG TPA: prepilin-type N-terminal cleavage/methylation domain-containing protein [Candidatus Binatia bacterium]|nr:prepilin-type N-terminal cleavage/methylation domain-containing protein [Candidatus Binatia bacterium]
MTPRVVRRGRERGFTLVETLVSLILLALIGTVIGVVFSAGFSSLLAPAASETRLVATSDALSLGQLVPEDAHRATCIDVPAASSSPGPYGTCSPAFLSECSGPGLIACFEWYDTPAGQCATAVYSQPTPSPGIERSQWVGGLLKAATPVTAYQVSLASTLLPPPSPPNSIPWFGQVQQLTFAVDGLPGSPLSDPPTVTITLQPLATLPDPSGLGSTGPC